MSTKNTTPAKTTNSSALAQGYFRQPDVQGERVVFQSEDDLWEVPLVGGTARRLTNSRSETRSPRISPDGAWIALCAMEEGDHDVYLMPTSGGEMQRLTWLNSVTHVVGWSQMDRTCNSSVSTSQSITEGPMRGFIAFRPQADRWSACRMAQQ